MISQTDTHRQAQQRRRLKAHLVDVGLAALSRGDLAYVQLITELIQGGSLRHV